MKICCLYDPKFQVDASNKKALNKFIIAAKKLNHEFKLITRRNINKVSDCDALFIRVITHPNNYTFTASRIAKENRIKVVDDPDSIRKCANKVFLFELFRKHGIPIPRTKIVNKRTKRKGVEEFGYPLVIKLPDSFGSKGVKKINNYKEYMKYSRSMFRRSALIILQEFMPTKFDWRVGVLNRKVLFVCKYYMAKNHWKIIKNSKNPLNRTGRAFVLKRKKINSELKKIALHVAKLIGNGLYAVDIKEYKGKYYVIEANDNPTIDGGVEDRKDKDVYERIIKFLTRK